MMGSKFSKIPMRLPNPPVPSTTMSTLPLPLLTPADSSCSTIEEPNSFLEVRFSSLIVIASNESPLTTIDLSCPDCALPIISVIGTSSDPPKGSLNIVKNMAITATDIRRYMKMLRMERGFILFPSNFPNFFTSSHNKYI